MSSLHNLFRSSLQISKKIPTTTTTTTAAAASSQTCMLFSLTTTHNSFNATTTSKRQISSNRSKRGLYDGKDIRSGNNVSFSMKKTKRKFKPNVFKKRLYSEMLDEMIQFHVTTSALRTIDKYGGLDNYLLQSRHVKEGQGEGGMAKKRLLTHIDYCQRHGLDLLSEISLKSSATGGAGNDSDNGTSSKGDAESTL